MLGTDSYTFEDKNRWRVIVWHKLVARLKRLEKHVTPESALVLYLSGEKDHDRRIAERKGFKSENLISVEIDKDRTSNLRKNGVNVINANILDIPYAWRHKAQPDIVYLDLCSNASLSILEKILSFITGPASKAGTIFMVNLQRGREQDQNVRTFLEIDEELTSRFVSKYSNGFGIKHRGLHLLAYIADSLGGGRNGSAISGMKTKMIRGGESFDVGFSSVEPLLDMMRPELLSYKGKRVIMDTLIFTNCLETKKYGFAQELEHVINFTKNRISAAMAIRTNMGK